MKQTPLGWAVDTFGPVALNRDERALRLVEEAIEFAQAEGVPAVAVDRVLRHVYAKEPGDPTAELRGVALTLDACAELHGTTVADLTACELARVQKRSKAEWEARHHAKAADGRADLSIPDPKAALDFKIAQAFEDCQRTHAAAGGTSPCDDPDYLEARERYHELLRTKETA